jgi:hypothetical protein
MAPARAFYSVVQYVPDGGRAEAANAGVLLWVPSAGRIEVRTSPTLARVRKFFGPGKHELRRIESALAALKHRMELAGAEFKDEADFARFAAARADAVRLTAPRLAMVVDPVADLDALFAELVGDGAAGREGAARGLALPVRVAEVFGRLEAEGRAWRPGSITVPTIRRPFDVSMAYQNGAVNYVRPEPLAPGRRLESRLERLGFNGRLIHEHGVDGKSSKLVVLSSDPGVTPAIEDHFRKALVEFGVRFVPHADAGEFAAEVERTAH